MTQTRRVALQQDEKISCTSCMKDIPRSAAKSSEASGYILYFCGVDCYNEWNRQAERAHFKQPEEHQTR